MSAEPPLDHRFPCPNCGADLRFSPQTGALTCDFCGHEEATSIIAAPDAIQELDFAAAVAKRLPDAQMEETRVSRCPNCGAEVEFDADIHATDCPFCATPVVTDTGIHRHIKPAGLIRFRVAEDAAHSALADWLKGLWFAPNGLTRYARKGRRMTGVYLPYWTFDARTRSRYRGMRGRIHRTTRRGADGKMHSDTTIRWSPASGTVARDFDDVLVLASKSLPGATVDALEPWHMSDLVPYSPDFLAGFRAEGYGIPLEDGREIARAKMDAAIQRDVRMDIGGDRQRIDAIQTQVTDVTFKHILLPLWLAAFTYGGKSYRVVVNAQTGRVTGERPYSKWKIAFAVLVALIVAGIGAYFGGR
ncbi:TFIIB zinc-binding protein [Rhodobacteraceae bacterium THAF1]|uniref:TFIIB-type zinc finger domain-containing protein n=1 Tax=Palleronia sp. THAF1 TaxID=2587842 RepID=UPI000F3E71C2|nr:TFIIB-type zinc finger domain-containing protein [Palleronia sp. THAF1]QFU09312.1 TFIIB zinc-binding protein [Palleronia sp. THAF1]VDC26719.1 TFIIB zinc-binding protein [Rhodobacteraceae bacterium THAF1]